MKKKFIIALFSWLTAALPVALVQAQEQDLLAFNHSALAAKGTKALAEVEIPSYKSHVGVYVRAKVMRTFLQFFADATDVQWHLSNNRYFASFTKEGRLGKALFDYNGMLLYAIHYGTEKNLPRDVRKQLRSTYIDYAIGGVSEVDANHVKSWVVNLQDADNLIIVQVTNGALDELHHYKTHF